MVTGLNHGFSVLQEGLDHLQVTLLARHEERCAIVIHGLIYGCSMLQKNSAMSR